MKKKVIALTVAAILCFSTVGCGSNSPSGESAESSTQKQQTTESPEAGASSESVSEVNSTMSEETITVALQAEPSIMLSVMGQATTEAITILGYLCDRLVDYNEETYEILPALATEWEYTDETHIKFTLRDDVYFADGSKFTANDVYYTFATAVELVPSLDTGKFVDIEETEVVDDTTIILGLTEALPDFLITLAETGMSIIGESAVEAAGGLDVANTQNPNVGSGKYTVKEWAHGEYILLERNENYWDKEWTGYYQYVKFIFINDSASRIMAVESGDAQIAIEVPMSQAMPLQGNDKIQILTYDDGSVAQIYFQCTGGATGVFNDVAVRQAASMAIDRNAIKQVLTAGTGELAQGIISDRNEYYTQVVDSLETEVDIEGAKKLLADAGYTGTIQARAITLNVFLPVLTVVQENLRQIGIELQVDTLDTPQYVQEARAGNYDVIYGSQTYPVRNATLFCLFDTTQNQSLVGGPRYGNASLDQVIITAKTSMDKAETTAAFKTVLEEIISEYTFVGICTVDKAYVADDKLAGVNFWLRGCVDVTSAHPAD